MEISSYAQEDEGRFTARTLSDISIASNASGKAQALSSLGGPKHVKDMRVKFLCSHGGKILPRPSDKRLRYVGGDTRMISVPRHIQLTALRVKLAEVYGHDVTFKYQLPEEDLDALVSVSSDEDLENMMEECDRLDGMGGSSRLRVFVFSSSDHDAIDFNDDTDPKVSETRYVEAVNTVQGDMSYRQTENAISPDLYKNSLGLHASYVLNTAVMQERFPFPSENLHSQVYPLEQFTPVGSYPLHTLPQKNNLLGHIAPPPRIAVTKQRNELASSLHANNVSSHGPPVAMDDFLDLESEQTAYRIDEDQMFRAEPRGQEEALIDSKVHAQFTAPFLPTSEQICSVNTAAEDKNSVHEEQPLSPGSLLQRQLQEDQNHLGTDSSRTFGKQGSQSSLDGNRMQPTLVFPLSHERQQIEQVPVHQSPSDIIQEGLLAGVDLLSEHLKVPGTTVDISKMYELDGLKQHVAPSTNVSMENSPMTALDFGMGSQTSWLAPDLVSFPLRDSSEVDMLDQIRHQSKMANASGVTTNQLVGGGLSLLDEPVNYNAAVSDAKVNLVSAAMRHCSTIDIMPDLLPSAMTMNCCSSTTDTLVPTLLDPLAKLGKEGACLQTVTDAISGFSLGRLSEDSSGRLHGAESVKQPVYQETAVFLRTDEAKIDICKKGIVDEGGAAINAEDLLYKEVNNTVGQREHEQILHVNYEQDAVELESSLVMESDRTIESSRLEVEEEDVFSSTMDRPMNAAAIAEAEAIARGLQTIRNFDLEELRELGSGTFGTVYHGKWRGTDVAIKRIKSSCFTGRPSERERLIADFWQEAFILGQLHHPNVVAFYGVVPDGPDGTLATVTEYMVNGSLKQALQKKDRILDRRKRLIIAMDAAFGMEYLHKKNVVHFDLKCENLLVNLRDIQRPICKVGDLGLSKVKQQTMISGGVRGTLPWMAPELLNGSSSLVCEKVDVFSFGIVLWELLTGEEPYASMHYGAIIGGIVTNTLRPPVPRWCDVAWRSLMEACWAADPAERPTFTEIANSLRAMEATVTTKGQGQAQNVE
ncbi:hypothetical protein GOP47_0026820 [Adiantum capillus-veneris]|nr:hypothetical protein GOP47_0026820 [Adiantum capillus-veneris]